MRVRHVSILYCSGYKYQLQRDYVTTTAIRGLERLGEDAQPSGAVVPDRIWLDNNTGTMRIRKGYAWDGSSGPTFDTKNSMRGSLGHDAKHQLVRMGLVSRDCMSVIDDEFYRDCVEDGMWKIRARIWIWALGTPFASKGYPSEARRVQAAP